MTFLFPSPDAMGVGGGLTIPPMTQTIDTYRLTSMEEPTDEVLSQLMKEAAEEARSKRDAATRLFFESLSRDAREISPAW